MQVAELASGALAAAAAGGSASTTAASELQHQQQVQQQCSSLVAALASFVGAPVILDRLLTPLDALLLEDQQTQTQAHELDELVLFERMAALEAALELAHVVHEFLGTCATCTLFEGRALTGLDRRLFRLSRHSRAQTSGWKCRLRMRLRRALTRSRATRRRIARRRATRAVERAAATRTRGDEARVLLPLRRGRLRPVHLVHSALRAQRRPLVQADGVARSARCE